MPRKVKQRRYFKVQKLPEDIKDQLDKLLADNWTYPQISQWLRGLGHDVSHMAVKNYHQFTESATTRIREFESMWKRMTEDHDGTPMSEAIIKSLLLMAIEEIMEIDGLRLRDDENKMSVHDFGVLIRSITRVQAVEVQINKWNQEVRENARELAGSIDGRFKGRGVPKGIIDQLKRDIIGITEIDDRWGGDEKP